MSFYLHDSSVRNVKLLYFPLTNPTCILLSMLGTAGFPSQSVMMMYCRLLFQEGGRWLESSRQIWEPMVQDRFDVSSRYVGITRKQQCYVFSTDWGDEIMFRRATDFEDLVYCWLVYTMKFRTSEIACTHFHRSNESDLESIRQPLAAESANRNRLDFFLGKQSRPI